MSSKRKINKSLVKAAGNGHFVSEYRKAKLDNIEKCMIVIRENEMPQVIRPVRVRTNTVCAKSGRKIYAGDFVYKCNSHPIQLTPWGSEHVIISEVTKLIDSYLPSDSIIMPIPSFEAIINKQNIRAMTNSRRRALHDEGTKMLKSGYRYKK